MVNGSQLLASLLSSMIKEFEGRVTCDIPGSYQYDDDSSKGIRVTFQVVPVRC